uniref:NADPH--hemoprotein reductase n=1 Tax=Henneguya salminicola TaxID=69463 RepID=A0A6G3MDS7_HENSL
MIGCGTGVAPYRGFIQNRAIFKQTSPSSMIGNMILFYGCRNKNIDYLFEDELQKYYHDGILSHIFCAFSRDSEKKYYITQEIIKNKSLIWLNLQKGAHIYICGEAAKILKDVQEAIYIAIQGTSNMDDSQVINYVKDMNRKGRYCVDVW